MVFDNFDANDLPVLGVADAAQLSLLLDVFVSAGALFHELLSSVEGGLGVEHLAVLGRLLVPRYELMVPICAKKMAIVVRLELE